LTYIKGHTIEEIKNQSSMSLQINIADLQENKTTIDLINKTKTPSMRHEHTWKEAQSVITKVCYFSLCWEHMTIMYSNILLLSSPEGTVLL